MASNLKLSNTSVNVEANAVATLFNSGYLRIYDGSQPATADTAITTQNLLAELQFNATAFGAAVAGVLTANAIAQDPHAAATGVAAWFRCFESDGSTVLCDGSVGTSGSDLNLNSVNIGAGASVSVSAFTYTVSKG